MSPREVVALRISISRLTGALEGSLEPLAAIQRLRFCCRGDHHVHVAGHRARRSGDEAPRGVVVAVVEHGHIRQEHRVQLCARGDVVVRAARSLAQGARIRTRPGGRRGTARNGRSSIVIVAAASRDCGAGQVLEQRRACVAATADHCSAGSRNCLQLPLAVISAGTDLQHIELAPAAERWRAGNVRAAVHPHTGGRAAYSRSSPAPRPAAAVHRARRAGSWHRRCPAP